MLLSFLLVIGPLVFIHELGHYLVGRWFGVKADSFSIGFGREVLGWTDRRGTRWKIGWLPLGGYVKFAGDMNPASQPSPDWLALPPEERAMTFQAKALWQRFLIVLAGPAANFLLAIMILCGVFATMGEPTTSPVIAAVQPNSAAQAAGLRPGDRVLQVGNRSIERFQEIQDFVALRPNETMALTVSREGRELRLTATTRARLFRDRFGNDVKIGLLGISGRKGEMRALAPHEIVGTSVRYTFNATRMIIDTMGQIITGRRSVKEMGGPLKIAQYSGQQASLGWLSFVLFIALISINLGFINLLPIPLLDGGHLLFYIIEGVRRRPVGPEAQEWAYKAGVAALLTLMVFVTFNDLASFGFWKGLGGLIG